MFKLKQLKVEPARTESTPKAKLCHFNTRTPSQHKSNKSPTTLDTKLFFSHELHVKKWSNEPKTENPKLRKRSSTKSEVLQEQLMRHQESTHHELFNGMRIGRYRHCFESKVLCWKKSCDNTKNTSQKPALRKTWCFFGPVFAPCNYIYMYTIAIIVYTCTYVRVFRSTNL